MPGEPPLLSKALLLIDAAHLLPDTIPHCLLFSTHHLLHCVYLRAQAAHLSMTLNIILPMPSIADDGDQ